MALQRGSSTLTLASPNQASNIFNPSGPAPVRQKHLFLVSFLRKASGVTDEWKNGLSFVVKSIDRPSVKPMVEELNQYNKKRQIQTGVKYDPISVTIYDTIDNKGGVGAAMKMWLEYASYYFGDYNHFANAHDFGDDVLNEKMNAAAIGYGMTMPKPTSDSISGADSQFFFEGLEVLQVLGNKYTKYTLINPRISSFTPDDLDYSNSEVSTIQMQISYEAIVHDKNGQASPIDAATSQRYGLLLKGNVVNYSDDTLKAGNGSTTTPVPVSAFDAAAAFRNQVGVVPAHLPADTRVPVTTDGGVLSPFGNFGFGDTSGLTNGLPSEVSMVGGVGSAVGSIAAGLLSPAVLRGVYSASQSLGVSPLDVVSRADGLELNSQALAISNLSNDGTTQIGFRRDIA